MSRIAQYEMAYRIRVRAGTDRTSRRSRRILAKCTRGGAQKGTFANCCLMSPAPAERGVRFVQIYHTMGISCKSPRSLPNQTKDVDQSGWLSCRILSKRQWMTLTDLGR